MQVIHLAFLGVPTIRRGDQHIPLTRAKGIALLLYLAITRVAQPRDRILDLLWPESMPQAARKNMRNTLWAIGEALGHDLFEQDGTTIRLAANVQVDVHALEDALLLLRSNATEALEAAAAFYRGPLADGLALHEAPEFELWLSTERERLSLVYLRLLERIVELQRAAGDWQEVIAQAQRALAADPLREPMHLAVIEAHIGLHQRAQAVQQYALLVDTLRRELDVAPLPETTARYEGLLADTPVALPQPQPARPTRVPEPSLPFVGREQELAALDRVWAQAVEGGARVALVTGDLGMGKSALVHTWTTRLQDALLVTTHALETGEPVPFGPLLRLFRQPGPARALIEPSSPLAPIWLTELARLLPEISAAWPGLPAPLVLSPLEERARLLQALTEVVRLLAQTGCILVIDDLHWADPSTLDWLAYLVDHLRNVPLLVVGTYRTQDASERLTSLVAGWQRQGLLHRVFLEHLSEEEGHRLLAALGLSVQGERTKSLVHQSGGNPYFLIELSRTESDEPPCNLATLVQTRVAATLPASALQTLQAAAVLGDDLDFSTLRATSGRSEEETLDALDALVAAAVIQSQEGKYGFVHPLVAEVVRRDLSPTRRAFLHRRAAEALERTTPQPEPMAGRLVNHFVAAGDLVRAAHYAEQAAGQAVQVGAFVEATDYARRATEWQPTAQRHLLLGEALSTAGNPGEAQIHLEQALQIFEQTGDAVGSTRASIALALMSISSSEPDVARARIARAPLQRALADEPALTAHAHLLAASVERQSQNYDAAAAQLALAEEALQANNQPVVAGQIAFERGNLLANRGDLEGALEWFAKSLEIARTYRTPMQEAMAGNNLAYHMLLAGDVDAAQRYIHDAAALADQYELSFFQQYIQSTLGEIALAAGDLEVADTAFIRAYEAAETWSNRIHMANVRANQAQAALARNDQATARTLITKAQQLFNHSVDPFVQAKIATVLDKVTR